MGQTDEANAILAALAQLNIDVVHAYEIAIGKVDEPLVHAQLTLFKEEHARQVDDVAIVLQARGMAVPERQPDLGGLIVEGLIALRSAPATCGALRALRTTESLVKDAYASWAARPVPRDVQALLAIHQRHEEAHLRAVTMALLQEGQWPAEPASGAPSPHL